MGFVDNNVATGQPPHQFDLEKDFTLTRSEYNFSGTDWTNGSEHKSWKPHPSAARALRLMAGLPETSRNSVAVMCYRSSSGHGWAFYESYETLDVYIETKRALQIEGYETQERFLNRLQYAGFDPVAYVQQIVDNKSLLNRSCDILFDDGTTDSMEFDTPLRPGNFHRLATQGSGKIVVKVQLQSWVLELEPDVG